MDSPKPTLTLYYDGDCPICSRYRDYVALRQHYEVDLRDARQHPAEIRELADRGYDINTGMILIDGSDAGRIRQGAEAVVAMRAATHQRGVADLFFRLLLRMPWLVRLGYPFARLVRNLTLRLTGRDPDVQY